MCNCKGYTFAIHENEIKIQNMQISDFDSWSSNLNDLITERVHKPLRCTVEVSVHK